LTFTWFMKVNISTKCIQLNTGVAIDFGTEVVNVTSAVKSVV